MTKEILYSEFILYWKACFNNRTELMEKRNFGEKYSYKNVLGTYECPLRCCDFSFTINEKNLKFLEICNAIEERLKGHLEEGHKIKVSLIDADKYMEKYKNEK